MTFKNLTPSEEVLLREHAREHYIPFDSIDVKILHPVWVEEAAIINRETYEEYHRENSIHPIINELINNFRMIYGKPALE